MTETWFLLLAFTGGLLLGMLFYGGLWWTVRKGLGSRCPAVWFLASFLLRTGIVMAGIYALTGGRWQRLLICLLGLIAVRLFVTGIGKKAEQGNPVGEAGHAA